MIKETRDRISLQPKGEAKKEKKRGARKIVYCENFPKILRKFSTRVFIFCPKKGLGGRVDEKGFEEKSKSKVFVTFARSLDGVILIFPSTSH